MKPIYLKTKLNELVRVSKIVMIHYYEVARNFAFRGESHDFWEMVYVDKGDVMIQRDDEEILLKQGEIVFHRPNEFHSIRALDTPPNFFVVSFECTSPAMQYFEKYQEVLDSTLRSFISSIIKEADQIYVLPKNDVGQKKLIKKENAPLGSDQLIKTYLEQLLIFLLRGLTQKGEVGVFPSKESMENHLVTAVKEYLRTHVEDTVRVGDLCREFGYSRSYLSRLFLAQTGETLANYATVLKIGRAKQLIRENDLNFAQISAVLSFENPQYFSRVFKRVTGMSPTEFKRSLDRQ